MKVVTVPENTKDIANADTTHITDTTNTTKSNVKNTNLLIAVIMTQTIHNLLVLMIHIVRIVAMHDQ